MLGFLLLATLGVLVHFHTAPWPFEPAFTKSLQGPHPVPCLRLQQPRSALEAAFFDVSLLNDPLPSVIGGAVWVGGMLLLRLWRQAMAFVLAVASVGGLFLFLTPLVGRPRPSITTGICVHDHYAYFSFPSGHVSHDVVCYGFLLYVTLSEPVRRWRSRWLLIPFQLLFVFDLLSIGYSRVLEGDHWLLDVVGGYLVGVLWLSLFIFLYRWAPIDWSATDSRKWPTRLVADLSSGVSHPAHAQDSRTLCCSHRGRGKDDARVPGSSRRDTFFGSSAGSLQQKRAR